MSTSHKPNLLEEMRSMHKEVNAIVTAPRVAHTHDDANDAPHTTQAKSPKKSPNLVELNKQAEIHGQEAEFINELSKFLKKYEMDYLPAVR